MSDRSLGRGSGAGRGQGEPPQLRHLVPAHDASSPWTARTLRIGVPNAQFREWLTKNYHGVLQEALAEVGQPESAGVFEESRRGAGRPPSAPPPSASTATSTRSTPSRASWSAPPTSSPTPRPAPSPRSPPSPTTRSSSTAASASARPTSCTRSATTSSRARSSSTSLYISTDRFINEMINAIRFDRLPAFRQKYRAIDVLLDRRHPVHRRQGPHPGGVLPHLQRAARRAEADRGELATARRGRSRPSRSACTAASSGA